MRRIPAHPDLVFFLSRTTSVILILTMADDIGSDRVERLLRARGVAVVRFDLTEFPERA
jgi:hypothetical protein